MVETYTCTQNAVDTREDYQRIIIQLPVGTAPHASSIFLFLFFFATNKLKTRTRNSTTNETTRFSRIITRRRIEVSVTRCLQFERDRLREHHRTLSLSLGKKNVA